MTTEQKIISFFLRHPEAFVRMVSEFYAFQPHEIQKHFQLLDKRFLSNNYYCQWNLASIRKYKHQLDWSLFSVSCRAFADVNFIDEFLPEVVWKSPDPENTSNCLSCNPKIIWTNELIAKYENCIDFKALSYIETIPWSEKLIDTYIDRWDWENLSYQPNLPWSEQFIAKYENYWEWDFIILNEKIPWTIPLIEKYFHRFDHMGSTAFASNEIFTNTLEIIEEFADHLCWHTISRNPDLPWHEENLLERWKDRIDWQSIAFNEFLLKDSAFFEKNLHRWEVKPEYSFGLLSYNKSLPWSIPFIDHFIEYWNWNHLSENRSLPWSIELIDHYIDRWEWGYFEPSEDDEEGDIGERGLIGNTGIPWNIDWLIRYEKFIDMEALKRDWFIWDKAFKPYMNEKMVDTIFRLL
jgi:hypothetical protein